MEFINISQFTSDIDPKEICIDPYHWGYDTIDKNELDSSEFEKILKAAEDIDSVCIAVINGKAITEFCCRKESCKFVLFNADYAGFSDHQYMVVTYRQNIDYYKYWYSRFIKYKKGLTVD